jgi:hypothetical protein
MACKLLSKGVKDRKKEAIKMLNMKKIGDTLERIMVAVTFAEAGDQQTALKIMKEKPANRRNRAGKKVRKRVDRRPVLRT